MMDGSIEEEMNKEILEEWELENGEEELIPDVGREDISVYDAKRALVGAGARVLFYPTLMYNVVRNKIQSEFHWWDEVDQFILLGAVPFPTDVPRLKQLGVHGVVTLNESYETLVSTSLYHAHDIDHLVIPTRDYLFAPSYEDICQAVDFIQQNALDGKKTYVHCKAGRGRSTTIVICYLVQYKQMTPDAAYKYVRSIRPRVLLASAQWQAVQEFYLVRVVEKTDEKPRCLHNPVLKPTDLPVVEKTDEKPRCLHNPVLKPTDLPRAEDVAAFNDDSILVVTESDLDGYDGKHSSSLVDTDESTDVNSVQRHQFSTAAALEKFSSLRLQKMPSEKVGNKDNCSVEADQLGGPWADIRVY